MVRPPKYTDEVVTHSASSNYGDQFETEMIEAVTPSQFIRIADPKKQKFT